MGMYLITITPFLLFLTGGFQVNQSARSYLTYSISGLDMCGDVTIY